jgi:transcriptional regulator with XRE-family HTH domain
MRKIDLPEKIQSSLLLAALKYKNANQSDLAAALGLRRQTISQWCTGGEIERRNWFAACAALGISPSWTPKKKKNGGEAFKSDAALHYTLKEMVEALNDCDLKQKLLEAIDHI